MPSTIPHIIAVITAVTLLSGGKVRAQTTSGGSKSITLTPENLVKQPFAFKITVENDVLGYPNEISSKTLHFTIRVASKVDTLASEDYGTLYVFRNRELISNMETRGRHLGNDLKFEFDIDRRYVEKETIAHLESQFVFIHIRKGHIHAAPYSLGDFYIASLASFVAKPNEKALTESKAAKYREVVNISE